ncbi:MAG: SPOR domain-containing protein [Steroidobacteraceae bacterium]
MSRISARDYKKPSRSSLDLLRWREFGIGVLVGVVVTAIFSSAMHRHPHALAAASHSAALRSAPAANAAANAAANETGDTGAAADTAAGAGAGTTQPGGGAASGRGGAGPAGTAPEHYTFYQMLPHFEVVVPEKEHPLKPSAPTTPVERPGVYVLQAGSYRGKSEAQRVVKRLSLRGITAEVQRVAVDTDVWYRVRVGPINQLSELNRMRRKLEAANVDSLVIRVGD